MVTYYCAVSLDNFIAGPGGELDWLPPIDAGAQDYGYSAFYGRQDLVVMGRRTFELCLGFGDWPYKDKASVVLTRQGAIRAREDLQVCFETFDADKWKERTRTKQIYLNGGGEVARLFLEHGLIDRLELTVIPVTLGRGIPLFAPGAPQTKWKLELSRHFDDGLLQIHYQKA
jgi:dihydrofolate reductase